MKPLPRQADAQKLFNAMMRDRLSFIKSGAAARRELRSKFFGKKKTQEFYSRLVIADGGTHNCIFDKSESPMKNEARQADAEKIEITQEMIEAGVKALRERLVDVGLYSARAIAVSVYAAMSNFKVVGELSNTSDEPRQAGAIENFSWDVFSEAYDSWHEALAESDLIASAGVPWSGNSLYQEIVQRLRAAEQPRDRR